MTYETGKDWFTGKVTAPFTEAQVESIQAFQASGTMHLFTCGRCSAETLTLPGHCSVLLVNTHGFWCQNSPCDYQQSWAYESMTDWSWQGTAQAVDVADMDLELPPE